MRRMVSEKLLTGVGKEEADDGENDEAKMWELE